MREKREDKRERIESKGYLDARFSYSEDTGDLVWLVLFPGRKAGTKTSLKTQPGKCFIKVSLEKLDFKAHRLIWVMKTGERPDSDVVIDHIDGDPTNNRWTNLRVCSPKQNARNSKRPSSNTIGYKGVSRSLSKFRAYITVDRRQIHLGSFSDPREAHDAYVEAAKKYFGEYACLNR